MHRRSWLKLGLAGTAVLAVSGGVVALVAPGLRHGRLTPAAGELFRHLGRAMLQGSLPAEAGAQARALDGLVQRVDALIAGLPPHAQQELSQLLALLDSGAGRRLLAGLDTPWEEASIAAIQAALQSMRVSGLALRQQAYHALHDIVGGGYFSDSSTWALLGYPGPVEV